VFQVEFNFKFITSQPGRKGANTMGKDHHDHAPDARGAMQRFSDPRLLSIDFLYNFFVLRIGFLIIFDGCLSGFPVPPKKEDCADNRIDPAFRDYCSHKLIPLNQCR
jgi:hypothetical protein